MPNPLFKSPEHLVAEWPEVFEDLYMNTFPAVYIDIISIEFSDGRVWEIDISSYHEEPDLVIDKFINLFNEDVSTVAFKINISKLKLDIEQQTKNFFKI
jgi:hypothetical protein